MKLYGLFSYSYDWDSEYEDLMVVSDSTDKLEKYHSENHKESLLISSLTEHRLSQYETYYMIKEVEFI